MRPQEHRNPGMFRSVKVDKLDNVHQSNEKKITGTSHFSSTRVVSHLGFTLCDFFHQVTSRLFKSYKHKLPPASRGRKDHHPEMMVNYNYCELLVAGTAVPADQTKDDVEPVAGCPILFSPGLVYWNRVH